MRKFKSRVGAFSALTIVAMGANMLPAAAFTGYPTAGAAREHAGTVTDPEKCGKLLSGADASGLATGNGYEYNNGVGGPSGSFLKPADSTAGDGIDGRWVSDENGSPGLVFQLAGTGAQFVDSFQVIDHPVIGVAGDPQNGQIAPEAMESTVYAIPALNGLPDPDQNRWVPATITDIYDAGRNPTPVVYDDYARRWDLGGRYQYVGITAGGPRSMRSDGDAEIDALCAPTIAPQTPPPPDCTNGVATGDEMWPPNHKFHTFTLSGVTDPSGTPVTYTVTSVIQDEPVLDSGSGNFSPDAKLGPASNQVQLRAERKGNGLHDGRVYAIHYTATGPGGSCTGTAFVDGTPHDQGPPRTGPGGKGDIPIFSGPPCYNSLSRTNQEVPC